jgi:hypothetical protein
VSPRDRIFVREPEWQHLDAGKVSVALEIALHEPLSGIGAAAATVGNYSRDYSKKPRAQVDTAAQTTLGLMYAAGRSVPRDYVQAHMWLNLAASGASDAKTRDIAVTARDEAAATMTPAQIAEAQRMASEWTPK